MVLIRDLIRDLIRETTRTNGSLVGLYLIVGLCPVHGVSLSFFCSTLVQECFNRVFL